ncbi:MAG: matrixin family metalloprotease [Eubacteriaceae bacterium]|nr:matrixin family metalloprotease [Eubacteriaceae bacterium]
MRNSIGAAAGQWSSILPININHNQGNSKFYIFGMKRERLQSLYPKSVKKDTIGLADVPFRSTHEQVLVYSKSPTKYVYKLDAGGVVYLTSGLPQSPYYQYLGDSYISLALHEMGHMLGWAGHSPNSRDVMFETMDWRGPINTLTDRDRTHLQQIYRSFY